VNSIRPSTPTILAPAAWQLTYLFELSSKSWFIHIAVVTLVYVAQENTGASGNIWFVGMLALSVLMIILCNRIPRALFRSDRHLELMGWVHSIATIAVGLFWAWGAFVAAQHSFEKLLIYTFALGGTALGAVSSQHAVLRSCFLSIWMSIPGLSIALIVHDGSIVGKANGAMIFLFGIALTILAVRMNRFVVSNYALARDFNHQVEEQKLQRRRADTANQAKSRFLAHASHDLRQPVHAIGMLTANLRELKIGDEALNLVDKIDYSVRSLSGLFGSLLDLSALDLGRVSADIEAVSLDRIISRVAEQNAPAAREGNNNIRLVKTKRWVRTDPALISNILQNLVGNAIKYAPECDILIGCRRRGETISLVVADDGPGISESDQELVFQEFYRTDRADGDKGEGLGLGLALVSRYAALLGLDCRLISNADGGTMIEISGLQETEPQKSPAPRRAAMAHRLDGLKVFVVDDDEEGLSATVGLLDHWGCDVSASDRVPTSPTGADVLLTDYDLGNGSTGVDCAKAVFALDGRSVPVLIVTAVSEPNISGLDGLSQVIVLSKPTRPAQMRSALLSLVLEPAPHSANV